MIKPINSNILIDPLVHSTFLPSEKGTFEEIGIVLDGGDSQLEKGTKVYFDGWTASKFPTGEGDNYFWLVPFKDIRAIEHGNTIPELGV